MTDQTPTPAPAPEYRYCVGWMAIRGGMLRKGVIDIDRSEPIAELDDVRNVQEFLREHYGYPDLGVLSFSVYADRPV